MRRMGKNLAKLLIASTMAMPAIFGGCEKPDEPPVEPPKDTTRPEITIFSPLENTVYSSDTIIFEWDIIEKNFKSAYYTLDNHQTKTPIGQSGKKNLILPNANYQLITYTDDLSGNFSRENRNFSVDKIVVPPKFINPFVQPNDSTLNWYGSGDVNNDNVLNSQDLDRLVEVINGTYSNPSDTRLYDRADVNGDEFVNNDDLQLLSKKLNGTRLYLPGEWNLLPNRAEREDWLKKMLEIDKTSEIPFSSNFVCFHFSHQTEINFRGYGDSTDISRILREYPFDFSNNCRFNIPVVGLVLADYDSDTGHGMIAIVLDDEIKNLEDICKIEPQNDNINLQIGQGDLSPYAVNSGVFINGPPITDMTPGIGTTDYLIYTIKNNISTLTYINPNLITEREK